MKRTLLVVACLALGGLGASLGQWLFWGQPAQGQVSAPAVDKAALPKEFTSYRDVVKKVLPAVVSIEAHAKDGKKRPRDNDMQFPGDDDPARVGFGSGFIISPKGVIVTNNHVVEGADQALVQLRDGRKFTSKKIKTDPKTDLAIIELDAKGLPTLEFGDSSDMEIGDRVLAIGAPFGLAGTVTHGIISSKGRALKMNMYEDFLQTDAAINPGNSGGPLVSLDGKVIGINSAIKSRTGGFQGIGLAISSNLGKSIVNALLKDGVVKRGYLGVGIKDVDEEIAKESGLKEASGVVVTRLFPDAPGEKAGLKSGDVILRLGKKPIKDSRDLQHVVAGLPLGKPTDIEIVRGGKKQTLKVTIEEQPRTFGSSRPVRVPEVGKGAIEVEKAGMAVADLTPELAEALGYAETAKGVLIVSINRKGLAIAAGLKPGMLILSVNGEEVTKAKAAAGAIAKGSTSKGIELEVRGVKGGKQTVTLREEEE
jgi:serine protease Do